MVEPRVLHLIGGDLSGGAARGAYWLHLALKQQGVPSRVLTSLPTTGAGPEVRSVQVGQRGAWPQRLRAVGNDLPLAYYKHRAKTTFSTGLFGYNITEDRDYRNADIVHLHWVCAELLSLSALTKIDKPIVWTLRDMWPMTGGCHYAMDCVKYEAQCGACPQLGSSTEKDLSRFIWNKKRTSFPTAIQFVGISDWLSECARASGLLRNHSVRTIHNGVDVELFYPEDRSAARSRWDIPEGKQVVLAGATDLAGYYKGFDALLEVLPQVQDSHVLLFGRLDPALLPQGISYTHLGVLDSDAALRQVYSAADVFVAPSRMEAFGKTLIEAMACGTPVVCFDATGPKDIVTHEVDGYKAIPFDSADLLRGIQFVLRHPEPHRLRDAARRSAVERFDIQRIAEQYRALYREVAG